MKTKKLIAALLVIMMVAALLPFGAMAEEASPSDAAEPHADRMTALSEDVSVDKVSTLRDGFYISVNGQAFTAFDQTIRCGSGTAKLTMDYYGPVLTLTNATISKAENLGSADGVTYYAGLVYSTNYSNPLTVKIVGSCTMTAPAASTSAKVYEGIYADEDINISGGSLKISGYGIAVDSMNINLANCTITNCKNGIYSSDAVLARTSISATGAFAISANDLSCKAGTVNATLKADNTGENKYAVSCARVEVLKGVTLNAAATVNTKSFASTSGYYCAAVDTGAIYGGGTINAQLNITDTGKAFAVGVSSDSSIYGVTVNSNVKVSGTTGNTVAVGTCRAIGDAAKPISISAGITGASDNDIPLVISANPEEGVGISKMEGSVYISASTDAKNPVYGAALFGDVPAAVSDTSSRICINGELRLPVDGRYMMFEEDGDEACMVVDKNGVPAKTVVISSEKHPFKDVKSADYFSDPVIWAFENNITNGTSATTFGPNTTCTRAQVVTFLWRAMGCPAVENAENPFTDVKNGEWYTDAVLWAVENGITNGTSATTFSPNAKVTRAQTVTFLYRAADGTPVDASNPFKDVAAGEYYTDAVLWAVANGITNGTSATTFGPSKVCTRGQIVTFLYRFINE